jgi:hypothetical protein
MTIREEHVSVTEEPSGKYLAHFVPEKPVHPEKPAFKSAQGLYKVTQETDSEDTILIVKCDSTNTNTGRKGGTNFHYESLLGRKVDWGICVIHTHELPLRHAIIKLDGETSSDSGFKGPVCSMLPKIHEMEYDPNFKTVSGGPDLIEIPEPILKEMSTDQKMCYQLCKVFKEGRLPENLQYMTCGTMSHSRWLTTAESILFMGTRLHGFTVKKLKILDLLILFIVHYYFPIYFLIKVKHSIVDAPYHILTQLRILRTLPKALRDVVIPYIQSGAWYSHSENLLTSLICSQSPSDRKFALDKIIEIEETANLVTCQSGKE